MRTELADENGLENSLEAEDLPEFQETFMYVDATTEGASDTHYIWAENLQIAEYPKEHDYPMSKEIKRESKTPILRHVHQEIQKDLNELISAANNTIQKIDIMVGNPKNDNVKDKLYEIRDILMKALPYNKIRAKGIKMESKRRRTRRVNESRTKIMLTWDEYNKLCDLIDMDWKRWNKRRAKNVEIVADRALEHLGWITSKDFTGQSPKDVEISFTIPSALPDDEFSTGTQKSMTIYDLIDGMFWNESTKMDESMNWNGVTDKFIDNDNVQFTRKCPSCGKPYSITVPIRDVEDGCSAYGKGASIQDAFPNFSPDEREFFMSGICPDCWENM